MRGRMQGGNESGRACVLREEAFGEARLADGGAFTAGEIARGGLAFGGKKEEGRVCVGVQDANKRSLGAVNLCRQTSVSFKVVLPLPLPRSTT